jgi:hypothetical protein
LHLLQQQQEQQQLLQQQEQLTSALQQQPQYEHSAMQFKRASTCLEEESADVSNKSQKVSPQKLRQLQVLQQLLLSVQQGSQQPQQEQSATQFTSASTPLEEESGDGVNKRLKAAPRWSPTQYQLQVYISHTTAVDTSRFSEEGAHNPSWPNGLVTLLIILFLLLFLPLALISSSHF